MNSGIAGRVTTHVLRNSDHCGEHDDARRSAELADQSHGPGRSAGGVLGAVSGETEIECLQPCSGPNHRDQHADGNRCAHNKSGGSRQRDAGLGFGLKWRRR